MKKLAALLTTVVAASCAQQPVLSATMEMREPGSGSMILIDEAQGPCVGDARAAVYVTKDGARTPGCWITDGRVVFIVFFDGDTAKIPVQAFVKSKDA